MLHLNHLLGGQPVVIHGSDGGMGGGGGIGVRGAGDAGDDGGNEVAFGFAVLGGVFGAGVAK
ncbi:hypothetical protein ACWWAE_06240 [Xylella fastidiosa subsp. multiplex]|uniref:hypothetical protein n=1 Tax=Xylella fastidiosa TaxID=2371 RepID=UPI0035D4D45F